MHLLWMVIFGAIVGAIAKMLMPGRDPGGIIITIVLGILGSIVGGFLLGVIMPGRSGSPAGWIGSILGAVLLLWIYRMVMARRTPPPTV